MTETTKTVEVLRYTFTQAELLKKARESAQETQALEGANETLKEVQTQLKADVAKHQKRVLELSRHINQGYEYREVECEWQMDCPSPGVRSLFRLDTGETVREEPIPESEKQRALPFDSQAVGTRESVHAGSE